MTVTLEVGDNLAALAGTVIALWVARGIVRWMGEL